MFSGKQRFQPFALNVILDQLPHCTDWKCYQDQRQNMTDFFPCSYKFCVITSVAEISGYHKKYRHCKSCKYIGNVSSCSRKVYVKKDYGVSTNGLYHIQCFISGLHKFHSLLQKKSVNFRCFRFTTCYSSKLQGVCQEKALLILFI